MDFKISKDRQWLFKTDLEIFWYFQKMNIKNEKIDLLKLLFKFVQQDDLETQI